MCVCVCVGGVGTSNARGGEEGGGENRLVEDDVSGCVVPIRDPAWCGCGIEVQEVSRLELLMWMRSIEDIGECHMRQHSSQHCVGDDRASSRGYDRSMTRGGGPGGVGGGSIPTLAAPARSIDSPPIAFT